MIMFAISDHKSGDLLKLEEVQSYLSQFVSSMDSLQELYRNVLSVKTSIEAQKRQIELEQRVLDSLMKYGS
ncbi:hypothetical protein SAMN04490178_103128 [Propionispora vibrioides]|uniref:Uncharacterized protein n=1 Tax=Propionispora vibrioides TaxID=112903 RepID=A0A1H8R0K6_9FIRM|nr:hypothetical protein SAMN04490178_103128 [Propionispora vibrioides]